MAVELRNRFYALVLDGEGRLLVRDGALPSWDTAGPVRWNRAGPVTAALRERFGVEALVLRPLHGRRDDDGRGVWAYELALRGRPLHGRWIDGSGVAALADADQRALARAVLGEHGRDEELRPPWSRSGWYDRALAWVDARLDELGVQRAGEPEQRHVWAISSVLRVPTTRGDVYFKAVPPLFGHEPVLTEALAVRHPGRITPVLAVDARRRWLLMEDIGGVGLDEVEDVPAWEEAVAEYARIQLEWVGETPALLALGCPDRTIDVLEEEIDETLADPLLVELPRALEPDELARLARLADRLRDACRRLRALGIPSTLEHGDLHPGNVRVRAGGPAFYDWTDGAVSLPFFTMLHLFEVAGEPPPGDRVRSAYLAPWREQLSVDADDALALAETVGLFHAATGYRRIAHATEPAQRWELGAVFPYFVRRLLDAAL